MSTTILITTHSAIYQTPDEAQRQLAHATAPDAIVFSETTSGGTVFGPLIDTVKPERMISLAQREAPCDISEEVTLLPNLTENNTDSQQPATQIACSDRIPICVTRSLSVEQNYKTLETDLRNGEFYREQLPNELETNGIHCSTGIEAGYFHEWDGMTVAGIGTDTGDDFVTITVSKEVSDIPSIKTYSRSDFGLQALPQVGPTRATELSEQGYSTTDDIAATELHDLTTASGIGKKTAATIRNAAIARSQNEIITEGGAPPGDDPIFIDIETDGLSPSRVWLIGVFDSKNDRYMPFITTDPDDPGGAIRPFLMWFDANARNRTLITWNGWRFDYPVLREHIERHCPKYTETWNRASKRDLLRWARDHDNATLPGITNSLEDVAEAVGWEGHSTALDGALVARLYQQYIQDPCEQTELDWDKHKQYCEDDVRALQHIWEAADEAAFRPQSQQQDSGTQAGLNEW